MLSPVRFPTITPGANVIPTNINSQQDQPISIPYSRINMPQPITGTSKNGQIVFPQTNTTKGLLGSKLQPIVHSRPTTEIVDSQQESKNDSNLDSKNNNDIITVSAPNISSQVNNDAETLRVINRIPYIDNLPAFIYQRDPTTGKLTRYLAIEEDKSYDTDPNYGISQEWLLFQRQGDHYDRVAEWNTDPQIVDAERDNEQGVTTLNEGRIWSGPPRQQPILKSAYYEDYLRHLEYSQTQIEDQDDS